MGEQIRQFDWSRTPLGPLESWPTALKTITSLILHSRHPMFLWWGPELIQLYNDAYVPSFGVGKHPLALGQRGRECWQEIWPIIGPQIDDVLLRGEPCWHEDALVPIFRNGAIEDVYWTYGYSPVFDDAGDIAGVLVVCTETTARVLAVQREQAAHQEAELERSRLRRFFEQAPAGICILRGPDFVFDFANELYCRMVGRSDLLGKPLLEALPELRGQGFDDLLREVIRTNETFIGKETRALLMRRVPTSGAPEDVFFTFIYSPIRDVAGIAEGVAVFVLDVSEQVVARRQAEELARQVLKSEAEFRTLAESIPQLAWSARPDGYIDWFNRRWYEYTGATPDQMEGWGWQSVPAADRVDEVTRRWTVALETGVDFEMEFPMRRSDGVYRWHLTRAVPLRDEAGSIVRWFGTNTDIDDAKRAEGERSAILANAQAERVRAEIANRAKDEFLATASHELRTPLNAILGWARLLQSGQLDAKGYQRGVETIERNARAQVRLIDDILDGSRMITGKLHLEIRAIDMTQLVHAALDAVRPAAEAKRIALTLELDTAAAPMIADPERLQQVVWNLANNAIKFTPKHGAVHVTLRRIGADVELLVADTGQGIDIEFLPHVFERFRQGEGTTTRRHGGLGLGLALVRHLVEAHGGTVRAESRGLGQGATFIVHLPVHATFISPPASPRPTRVTSEEVAQGDASLNGIAILVVDDDDDARDLVATALRAKGALVTTAFSATRALELLAHSTPAVLISDIAMPEIDGYELIRRVRSLKPASDLPAIALTAYAREEDRRRALDAGFHTHVAKPVEPSELIRVVANVISSAR
jgi:PAS domain S-box-containing protein